MIFPFPQIHLAVVTTPFAPDADKQSGSKVPTMVLSKTRGQSLFLVVQRGIWLYKRLGDRGTQGLTACWILSLEPERLKNPTGYGQG